MTGLCRFCARPFGEHSLNTGDICNFYMEREDDVQRTVPDREGNAGGAGQGGVVSGDAAGQEDLREFTPCGWRWRVKGHWKGPAWVLTETLPQFDESSKVEVEPIYAGTARKPHKVMTPEEYAVMPLIGWHEVCRDVDGFGGVGIRFVTPTEGARSD